MRVFTANLTTRS